MQIKLSGIVKESIVDGPGIRYVLFTQGCHHNCYQCHNPQTHDINGGYLKDINEIINEISLNQHLTGITISGGEPFLQIEACLKLLNKLPSNLDVIIYTGFLYEDLHAKAKVNPSLNNLLKKTDYLIDGKFDYKLRDLELNFIGSSNQRIINLKKTFLEGKVILHNF